MANTNDPIFDFLAKEYGVARGDIDENTLLFSDGYLDSFSMVELVNWLEQHFKVKFGVLDITLDNLDSVARMSKYVSAKGA